jgi:capsular polysaccharide biosynthesis protein
MNNQTNSYVPESIKKKEINLAEHFTLLKKRLWIVVLITFITTSIGIVNNVVFSTPLYQSYTRMIVDADGDLMSTLQVLIRDNTILQKVVDDLGINRSPEGLAQQISVGSVNGSQIVSISVIDTDPSMAAEIANTTASVFKSEIPNIVGFNKVKLLTEAKINPYPINSGEISKIIVLAIIIGVVLGIGMIYFIDTLDDSIRSREEIEHLVGSPVLGTVAKMNKKNMKTNEQKQTNKELRGESIGY